MANTVKYTYRDDNFKYHFKKCKMDSNYCVIPKETHPIYEVEVLKDQLLKGGKLEEVVHGWKLKKDFETGILMARNLCSNKIINTDNSKEITVVINGAEGADKDIKYFFGIKNVFPSDSVFGKKFKSMLCDLKR